MTVRGNAILEKARLQGWLNGFDFSLFIQEIIISENVYIIDVGNWENINAEVVLRLNEKIKKAFDYLETFLCLHEKGNEVIICVINLQ